MLSVEGIAPNSLQTPINSCIKIGVKMKLCIYNFYKRHKVQKIGSLFLIRLDPEEMFSCKNILSISFFRQSRSIKWELYLNFHNAHRNTRHFDKLFSEWQLEKSLLSHPKGQQIYYKYNHRYLPHNNHK